MLKDRRNGPRLRGLPWPVRAALFVSFILALPQAPLCLAGPEEERYVNWTFPTAGYDSRGSFVAQLAAPPFQATLPPLLYNLTASNATSNYSLPVAISARANVTGTDLSWTALTSSVVDRNGTAVKALVTTFRDARWSWGLSVDNATGNLVDGEGRVVSEDALDVGLLVRPAEGNVTILADATLLIQRVAVASLLSPFLPSGGQLANNGTSIVNLTGSSIVATYRGLRLSTQYANDSWFLLLPKLYTNTTLKGLAVAAIPEDNEPLANGTPTNTTQYLRVPVVPGVYVNSTASYIKIVATSNRGTQAWQVDVPRAFGTVDRGGTSLVLAGPARDLFVLLVHDWERSNFSTWFLPSTEGFPYLAGGNSTASFVNVDQRSYELAMTNATVNGTNTTVPSWTVVDRRDRDFATPPILRRRPSFRGSMLAPQLSEDGAYLFVPTLNRSTGRQCLARFDISQTSDTFFYTARNPDAQTTTPNRVLAECRTLPSNLQNIDRWQLLDTHPEFLNATQARRLAINDTLPPSPELQLIMFGDNQGLTIARWADLADHALDFSGGAVPPAWTTDSIYQFSSSVDVVPAAWGLNLSYTFNLTVQLDNSNPLLNYLNNTVTVTRYAASNRTLLYVLTPDSLQLLGSNVSLVDAERQLVPVWTRSYFQLWPTTPPNGSLVSPRRNAILFASQYLLGLCLGINETEGSGRLVIADAKTGKPLLYKPYYLPCMADRGSLLVTNGTWEHGVQKPTSNMTLLLAVPGNQLAVYSLPCKPNGEPLSNTTLEFQYTVPLPGTTQEALDGSFLVPTLVFPPTQILTDGVAYGTAYVPPPNDPISGQIVPGVSNFTFGSIIVLMVLVVAAAIGLGLWYLRGNRFGKKTHPASKSVDGMSSSSSSAGHLHGESAASPSMATSSSRTPLNDPFPLEGVTAAQTPRVSMDSQRPPSGVLHGDSSPTHGAGATRDIRLAATLAAARVVSSLRVIGQRGGQALPGEERGLGISGAGTSNDQANRVLVVASPPVVEEARSAAGSGDSESTYNWNTDAQMAGAMMLTRRPTVPAVPTLVRLAAEEASVPVVVRTSLDGAAVATPAYVAIGAATNDESGSRPPLAPVDPRSSSARMARSPLMTHRYTMSDELGSGTVVSSGSVTDPDVDASRGDGVERRQSMALQSVPSSLGQATAADDLGSSSSSVRI